MKKKLYNPKRIELPSTLILIPHFYDPVFYRKIKAGAARRSHILQSEVLVFNNHAVITGFLGYPSLLLILEFINNVNEKEVFFLGTAGSLNEKINSICSVHVKEIYSSSIFRLFSRENSLELKTFNSGDLKNVKGVSVDIIQRETASWLKKQISRGIDIVEMELFPLRVYLNKPFHAIVVITDRVTLNGIKPFSDHRLVKKNFVNAFELIRYSI